MELHLGRLKVITMKKILYIAVFLFISRATIAQVDTPAVLKNLLSNRLSYIGKPCSKLLSDFPCLIKQYWAPIPFKELPDTLNISQIELDFIDNQQALNNIGQTRKNIYYKLTIYFKSSVPTPKRFFKRGEILETGKDWDSVHAKYFGQAIVSDFKISVL